MAMELYDAQYLLILAPTLVIALMFLFFWLFMKETSYDEVLARQKRELKLPPSKPDARKKGDKKKSKKKESSGSSGGGGSGGGGGGESEEDPRDFDLTDAVVNPTPEEEQPLPTPPAPILPAPTPVEPPSAVRERKKKEKKQQQQQVTAPRVTPGPAPTSAPTSIPTPTHAPEEPTPIREVNGSKPTPRKNEPVLPVTKQPSPPSVEPSGKKKGSQKKQKSEASELAKEKQADELQLETKVEQAAVQSRKEIPVAVDAKVQDGTSVPTTSTTSSKKKNSAKKQKTEPVLVNEPPVQASLYIPLTDSDSPAPSSAQKGHHQDAPVKVNAKKQKNETDKEHSEVKLKDFLAGLRSLALSEEEAVSVAAVLREKSPSALDAWHRSAAKAEPSAQQIQERERLLTTLQEEASIAKEKVKQLSQELQMEKQKTGRVEALLRDQRGAMEEQLSVMQAKAQNSYQEVQMKFQQAREQLEGQISRLQQENKILRDAVSTATNQMESKQASELNQLRSERAALIKELSESGSKLQQEDMQRKSLEVNYKQNISQLEAQLQDAKCRWEELQGFLHSVNADREKLQANKQELQNKLLAAESEMGNKNKEIQNLHSSLTDMMVTKEELERKVMQLLEVSQRPPPDDSLQVQVQDLLTENKSLQVQIENLQSQVAAQTTTALHIDELQKLLAEKEHQRKSLEDSLNTERSAGASRENDMQALHTENMMLKAELQKAQAQMAEQASSQLVLDQLQKSALEKDEKIKTVEKLLEAGLIEVANKEEDLKTLREKNEALKRGMEALQLQQSQRMPSESVLEELQRVVQEKDESMRMVQEKLQAEMDKVLSKEKALKELEKQVDDLRAEVERARQRENEETAASRTQLQELRSLLAAKDEEVQTLRKALREATWDTAEKEQHIQTLQEESSVLRIQLAEQQQVQAEGPSQELLSGLLEKEAQLSHLQTELEELRASLELQRRKNNELREKNWSAMDALSATESMLQGKLSKTAQESQKAVEAAEASCREVLHRLLPSVPLPSSQNHQEWLQRFETAAKQVFLVEPVPAIESGDTKMLEEKLKESEEAQKVLQKDCETYKKVLAETEGILQRLQNSVEQEESRWRVRLEVSQGELNEMNLKVVTLESEVDRLNSEVGDLENLRHDKQHLESELERAERESATYVTEVRELKDLLTELQSKLDGSYTEAIRQNEELTLLKSQLTETLFKLETEEKERQKVAGDLYKAQQSLDLIQAEILKEVGQADLIENSTIATQREEMDRREKTTAGLDETVRELQQLLQAVNRQLTKGREADGDKYTADV
ncbi:kinectin-like isoform X6 [Scleropages formosus]|uniref:kinectin-like isoform X6 n=1 Tax=Scleropages formosus TaxID=113540 RepID=UPI0010FACAD1|nr:kinectin isoform X6 [Scleropages formosus]